MTSAAPGVALKAAGWAVTILALGGVTFMPPAATAASTRLGACFETGTLDAFASTSNASVGAPYAKTGSYGARVVATSERPGYLSWSSRQITQGQRYGRIRGWVKIESFQAGQPVSAFTMQNAHGSNHFDLWRDARTGKWRYDLLGANTAFSTMSADLGRWYYLEALVDFGGAGGTAYTAEVRIDGITQPTISSTSQVGSTVKSAWFGTFPVGQVNARHYDALVVDVGNTPFPFTR